MPYTHLRRRFAPPVFAAAGPTQRAGCGGQRASATPATTTTPHPAVRHSPATADRGGWDASANGSQLRRSHCTEAT